MSNHVIGTPGASHATMECSIERVHPAKKVTELMQKIRRERENKKQPSNGKLFTTLYIYVYLHV